MILLEKTQILCMEADCRREKLHHCLVYGAYVLGRLRRRAQKASGHLEEVLDICLGRNALRPNSFSVKCVGRNDLANIAMSWGGFVGSVREETFNP